MPRSSGVRCAELEREWVGEDAASSYASSRTLLVLAVLLRCGVAVGSEAEHSAHASASEGVSEGGGSLASASSLTKLLVSSRKFRRGTQPEHVNDAGASSMTCVLVGAACVGVCEVWRRRGSIRWTVC